MKEILIFDNADKRKLHNLKKNQHYYTRPENNVGCT